MYYKQKPILALIIIFSLCINSICFGQGKKLNKDIRLSGSVSFNTILNSMDSIEARRPGFSFAITGNPTLHLKGFKIPLRFIFSNFQQNFRQPFNQFGISPNLGKMKLYLGHNRLSWAKYSLNGHRFLGIGADWNPGILRIGAMAGRFMKAVEKDSSFTTNRDLSRVPRPAFNRNGQAIKIGIGKDKNYIDLVYFKAKDQLSSLSEVPILSNVFAAENASLGLKARFNLKVGLYLKMDLGISGFTRDLQASVIEVNDFKYQALLNKILTPRNSTQVFGAGEINVGYRSSTFGIDFRVQRVDPGYQTMGAYYFQSDIQRTLLGFNIQGKKRKFKLQAKLGLQEDNLLSQKLFKTKRRIGNLNIFFNPVKALICNVQYANFGTAQEAGLRSVSDTTRLDNIVSSLIINPMLQFNSETMNHSINLIWSNQNLNDENRFTSTFTEIQSNNLNLNYGLQLVKQRLGINVGLNHSSHLIPVGETTNNGFTIGANTSLFKNKLRLSSSLINNKNQFEKEDNGVTKRWSFNLSFSANKVHSFRFQYFVLENYSLNILASKSFKERTARLIYTHRFITSKNPTK